MEVPVIQIWLHLNHIFNRFFVLFYKYAPSNLCCVLLLSHCCFMRDEEKAPSRVTKSLNIMENETLHYQIVIV